ncbi:MAG TPA: protein kinase [Gemmatimonadales bacterium]|nr:protein kinase [Gemmatimonadales bacterium]
MTDQLARLQAALRGRYTIERELGRGGMATVYLARDEKHRRSVALKVLRPELAAALGSGHFLREIGIAARLAHPHILALHDSGDAGGFLYYVMPYVEGESLGARLKREGRLPVATALDIAREVADALSDAHEHGIVHRDVKPENILLTRGHALVADFGIARAISAAAGDRLTGSGIVVGTLGYMSPEQAADQPCDARSDIYSLGCVLYEMLNGTLPVGTSPDSWPLGRVPRAVRRVLERALAPAPTARFPTAAAFAAALLAARRSTQSLRFRIPRRRLRAVFGVGGALVVGAALWVTVGPGKPTSRAWHQELAAATSSGVARQAMIEGQGRFWIWDRDGAAAAYRRAIAADSDLALAYHRLSVVQTWQWDYPAARRTVEAALARREHFAPRWRALLEAERHYIMRSADSAIAGFQAIVVDFPRSPDAWYGLGEALFHFGGLAGVSPLEARPAFARVSALDPTFVPLYAHLIELAVFAHDVAGARGYLAQMPRDDPERPAMAALIALSAGDPRLRAETVASLATADRLTLKLLVAHFGHGGADLPLTDTIARFLSGPDRTPDDRRTGGQYRFVALAGQGRWPEAVAVWDSLAGGVRFDRWMVLASLAGFPAPPRVTPMLSWARGEVRSGRSPDFRRPVFEESEQAFQATVHEAVLHGDSSAVRDLLGRLERATATADPSDPLPPALQAALEARLALLARDTTRAMRALQRSVARSAEPFAMYYPLAAMAPERWLLAQFARARRDRATATRCLDSFTHTWSLGDALYTQRVACLRDRLLSPDPC